MVLCETKLPSDQVIKNILPGFEINSRPTKSGQNGLAIGVKTQTFNSVLDVTSSSHNSILVTRIEMNNIAIRIILGYAPQETDIIDTREHFFTELEIELHKCKIAGDTPYLVGDMNAKIEIENNEIIGSSRNGKLLAEVIKNQELVVLNYDKRCRGKWTHVIRTTGASSVLDYVIVSRELLNFVKEVMIDEECAFCPFGLTKKITQYSDHNAIVTSLTIPYTKKKKPEEEKSWRLSDDGFTEFREITNHESFPTEIEGSSAKQKYNQYEKLLFNTMNQCFQKAKQKKKREYKKDHAALYRKAVAYAKKGKAQRKVSSVYFEVIRTENIKIVAERTKENIKSTLKNLTIDGAFSPNNFWELCKKNRQNNKCNMGSSVISINGNEVCGEELIKETYKEEFRHRLRERSIIPELKNYEQRTKLICDLYVEEAKSVSTPDYTYEELEQVTRKLKKRKASGRDRLPPEIMMQA